MEISEGINAPNSVPASHNAPQSSAIDFSERTQSKPENTLIELNKLFRLPLKSILRRLQELLKVVLKNLRMYVLHRNEFADDQAIRKYLYGNQVVITWKSCEPII